MKFKPIIIIKLLQWAVIDLFVSLNVLGMVGRVDECTYICTAALSIPTCGNGLMFSVCVCAPLIYTANLSYGLGRA